MHCGLLKQQKKTYSIFKQNNSPKSVEIERKYGLSGELTLQGYEELFEILDNEWLMYGGGF
jgi:hypothetical protein